MTEQMQGEIAALNSTIEEIDDPRQCLAIVQERIRNYAALGYQIPQELSLLERRLTRDCLIESQCR